MIDILTFIYEKLVQDEVIATEAADRIKFYEFPEPMSITENPVIVISPLNAPLPGDFGDDVYFTFEYLIQIETWSKSRSRTQEIAETIQTILWRNGFAPVGGVNEYDSEIFRDARRYRGKLYRDEVI